MTDEQVEDMVDQLVATALRVEALERQVMMLGAAVTVLQEHLDEPELNEDIEEAMRVAADEKRAQQDLEHSVR